MSLSRTLLHTLETPTLKRLALDLPVADRRKRLELLKTLEIQPWQPETVISKLYEAELSALSLKMGLSSTGTREQLQNQILARRATWDVQEPLFVRAPPPPVLPKHRPFVAIDFETADHGKDSACAIGLVRAEGGHIVRSEHFLIRPPRRQFVFTYVHQITYQMVAHAPTFGEIWHRIAPILEGADFFAAHNSPFDQGVLEACCTAHRIPMPAPPFIDTVKVARRTWDLYPTKLPNVCAHLSIPLNHHDALSDALACAKIVLAAKADLQ
jgi:DNA polymerase-3 subunit epsilon